MVLQLIYILLALLGLSFLVFIHELGHYIMAIRNGIKVEVFSIGFGKPFLKWKVGDVEWRLCFVLFGGYVKMAGQEKQGNIDPAEVKGGFYHATPLARIKVAIAGPLVNIAFAFIAFFALFLLGGRKQPFSQHTKIIGWVESNSDLYAKGVRPGAQIDEINGHAYRGFKDLMYAAATSEEKVDIQGKEINYWTKKESPFNYSLLSYPDPTMGDQGLKSFGVVSPARYFIYDDFKRSGDNPILPGSSMANSGIEKGDRIVWINGQLIFSMPQLSKILSDQDVLLTIERDGKYFNARIPKVAIANLRLKKADLQELDDWKHAALIEGQLRSLSFIPYDVNSKGVIEGAIKFIDDNSMETMPRGDLHRLLQKGDKIVAVEGKAVQSGFEILKGVQKKVVHIIVARGIPYLPISFEKEDPDFIHSIHAEDLLTLANGIGLPDSKSRAGNLVLLHAVEPVTQTEFLLQTEHKTVFEEALHKQMSEIDQIKDPKKKQAAMKALESYKNQRILGISLKDREVIYNPSAFVLFGDVLQDTYRTFSSLVTGRLSPKWLSGPIGFIQVMQHGWSLGFKEALYWLGMISLGLAIFNLLPIPALDGGHIAFSVYEWITKKRISAKTMERMIIPFVVCLIGLFVFVTFQDIKRLLQIFFH